MRRSECRSYVMRHIACMKSDEIFTTRELLIYGKRTIIDKTLFYYVDNGILKRLTPGVFVRNAFGYICPPAIDIASIKAQAFGKQLLIHGADTAAKHGLIPQGNESPTFYVDGSSSKFRYNGQYVHLKKASKKIMTLPDGNAGLTIRAINAVGNENLEQEHIEQLRILWDFPWEKQKICKSKAWMPAWIADIFPTDRYYGPFGPGSSTREEKRSP